MENSQNILQRFALRVSDWSEKWFPDSYIFALLGVVIVAIASISIGAPAKDVAVSFGDGFWSLIPFIVKLLYYSYKIRKKLEITHRLSRSTILYAYV